MERRRADIIADEIENLIFAGQYSDGDRLDEIKLADRFGVSRTPIREALQKLVVSGLVAQIPRRGVFVRQPGPIELLEMFEVMAGLEAMCGRLAAQRISDKALAALNDANHRCSNAIKNGDSDAYYLENERFHKIIYAQSGNAFLEQEACKLHDRLRPYRRVQLRLRGRMDQSMREHEEIVKALENAETTKAGSALLKHVAVQGEKFHNLIASLKMAAE